MSVRARLDERRQRRRLRRTLAAARRLPGYGELRASWGPDRDPYEVLRELPVLDRMTVQADPLAYCDPTVASVPLSSSGSTGTPLSLRLDRRARWRRRGQFGRYFLANGWMPWHRSVSLKVVTDPSARLGSELLDRAVLRRRSTVSVLIAAEDQFEAVRRADPEILHGLPSALEELAANAERAGWRPRRLRRIFTVSEALTPAGRALLERALGAPVLDTYAASEALVGWECDRRDGIHVIGSNVVLEVVGEDGMPTAPGEVGHVLVTTLDNRAMPLVRYAIGDMAVAPGPDCSCGRAGPLLPRVLGREVPLFELGEGPVSPWGVMSRMHELDGVGQFQLVQDAPGRLLVKVRRPRSGSGVDRDGIARLVAEELGDAVEVEVEEVDAIDLRANGKAAPAIVREDSAGTLAT